MPFTRGNSLGSKKLRTVSNRGKGILHQREGSDKVQDVAAKESSNPSSSLVKRVRRSSRNSEGTAHEESTNPSTSVITTRNTRVSGRLSRERSVSPATSTSTGCSKSPCRSKSPVMRRAKETGSADSRRASLEAETVSDGGNPKSMRTRLSTGSIQMNGTTTVSAAKEAKEMEQIIKDIDKAEGQTTSTSSGKKRLSGALQSDVLSGTHPPPKKRKIGRNDGTGEDNRNDYFCWLCHKEGTVICCELCPRVYHSKCLGVDSDLPSDWVCPECEKIMRAECTDTRSKSMEMLSLDQLCNLLMYALQRMKHEGSGPFQQPVDMATVPNYTDYIFNPIDLTVIEKNIKDRLYGCTEALLADAKWILHNCIIYNGSHHKLTNSAKVIIRICKHEVNEIELCPDCYKNSCIRNDDDWFSEPCRKPHTLVWAKLKGYPFWPAKALREVDGEIDVRFFGAHDRSWVPVSQCFLLSKVIPTSLSKGKKTAGMDNAMRELNLHIEKLKAKFVAFEYAPYRTPYDTDNCYKAIILKQKGKSPRGGKVSSAMKWTSKPGYIDSSNRTSVSTSGQPKTVPNLLRKAIASKTASALKNKYRSLTQLTRKPSVSTPEKAVSSSVKDSVGKYPLNVVKNLSGEMEGSVNLSIVKQEVVSPDEASASSPWKTHRSVSVEKVSPDRKKGRQFIQNKDLIDKLETKIRAMKEDEENDNDADDVDGCTTDKSDSKEGEGDNQTEPKTAANIQDNDSVVKQETVPAQTDTDNSVPVKEGEVDHKGPDQELSQKELGDVGPLDTELGAVGQLDTEPKEVYLNKLQKTIQNCKAKLGLNENDEISDSHLLDAEDSDEEEDGEEGEEKDGPSKSNTENNGTTESSDSTPASEASSKTENPNNDSDNKSQDKDETDTVMSACQPRDEDSNNDESVLSSSPKPSDEREKDKDEETDSYLASTSVEVSTSETTSGTSQKVGESSSGSEPVDKESNSSPVSAPTDGQKIMQTAGKQSTDGSSEMDTLEMPGKNKLSESNKESLNKEKQTQIESSEYTGLLMEVDNESDCESPQLEIDLDNHDVTLTPSKHRSRSPSEPPMEDVQSLSKHLAESSDEDENEEKAASRTPVSENLVVTPDMSEKDQQPAKVTLSSLVSNITPTTTTTTTITTTTSNTTGISGLCNLVISTAQSSTLPKTPQLVTDSSPAQFKLSTPGAALLSNKIADKPPSDAEFLPSKIADKFSKKILESIQKSFDEIYSDVVEETNKQEVTSLQRQLEQTHWNYAQELNEMKHNFQLSFKEMKQSWEAEKSRLVKEFKQKYEKEMEESVKETKKKQWCATCGKEAIFYCCWNTSYCDYPCQQAHWPAHMHSCLQSTSKDKQNTSITSNELKNSAADQEGQGRNPGQAQINKDRSSVVSTGGSVSGVTTAIGGSSTPGGNVPGGSPSSPLDVEKYQRQVQNNLNMIQRQNDVARQRLQPIQGAAVQFRPRTGAVSSNMAVRQISPSLQTQFTSPGNRAAQPMMMQNNPGNIYLNHQMQIHPMQIQRTSLAQNQQLGTGMIQSQSVLQGNRNPMIPMYPVQVQQQAQQYSGPILFAQNANSQRNILQAYGNRPNRPPY